VRAFLDLERGLSAGDRVEIEADKQQGLAAGARQGDIDRRPNRQGADREVAERGEDLRC
jgi:hypothetical protein